MEALDTLASEALSNGHSEAQRKRSMADASEAEPVGELEAEEAAGGPPMPAAGIEGAATKGALLDGAVEKATSAGHALRMGGGGVGDAAMAAVDDRVDTGDLPHTNGYSEVLPTNGHFLLNDKEEEVDYARVANLTGTDGGNERVPDMSVDVDQPARESEQGQPDQPAPGPDASVPLEHIDPSIPSLPSLDASSSSSLPSSRPPAEFQQTIPQPLDSYSQPAEQETISHLPVPMARPDLLTSSLSSAQAPPSFHETAAAPAAPLASDVPPHSMHALPDDPTPLPSQLVSASVPQTDLTQDAASSAIPPEVQALPSTRSYESTMPTNASAIPPTHPDFVAPASISPTIAKRPFEPDNSAHSLPYQGDYMEPIVKRQKISPDAEDQIANQAAMSASGILPRDSEYDAGVASADPSMLDNSMLDQSTIDQSLDNQKLDGEASPAVRVCCPLPLLGVLILAFFHCGRSNRRVLWAVSPLRHRQQWIVSRLDPCRKSRQNTHKRSSVL